MISYRIYGGGGGGERIIQICRKNAYFLYSSLMYVNIYQNVGNSFGFFPTGGRGGSWVFNPIQVCCSKGRISKVRMKSLTEIPCDQQVSFGVELRGPFNITGQRYRRNALLLSIKIIAK